MSNKIKTIAVKKSVYTAVILSIVVALSGCASKPRVTYSENKNVQAKIEIRNGAGYPSWAANESKAFKEALQTAANATLNKGYKYFAIISPSSISNINGSIKNSAKEILEFCQPSSLMALNFANGAGLHKCGTHNTNAKMIIGLYNEEQDDFVVINAQEVIDYYHASDIYNDTDIEYTEG